MQNVPELNQPWELHIVFANTGRTPAKNVAMSCNLEPEGNGKPFRFKATPPGHQYTLIVPNQEPYCVLHPMLVPKVTQEILDEFSTKATVISVFGYVTYVDVFHAEHWLTFCKTMYPDGKAWDDCDEGGNDTGDGKKPN
jgi:hypothetical protein